MVPTYPAYEARPSRRSLPVFGDRHVGVVLFLAAWLVVIPAIVLLGSLMASAYLLLFGYSGNIHATIFGWLSSRDAKGHWGIGAFVPEYFVGVLTAYFFYWIGEGACGLFRMFRNALSKDAA